MTDTTTAAAHLRPVPDLDDDTETTVPVAVDNPALPEPKVSVEKRKPVLAGWLTDRRDFTATARHAGANVGYSALFHGVRLPVYAGRLALMSPRGACRFIATTNRWIWDREAAPLRAAAVRAEDVESTCAWPGCARAGFGCAAWSPWSRPYSASASPCGFTSWPRR